MPKRGGKGASNQERTVKARRKVECEQLMLMGLSSHDIAEQLEVTIRTVDRYKKEILKDWLKKYDQCIEDLAKRKARELAQLDKMDEQEAVNYHETDDVVHQKMRLDIKARKAKMLGLDEKIQVDISNDWVSLAKTALEDE